MPNKALPISLEQYKQLRRNCALKQRPIGRCGLGLTLFEVLLATTVLAVTSLAALQAVSAGYQVTYDALTQQRAVSLGQALIEEIIAQNYEEPTHDVDEIGLDTGESARSSFDDIDDYHGYVQEADEQTDVDGLAYDDLHQRFRRSVEVEYDSIAISSMGHEVAGKQVTVTVEYVTEDGERTGRQWMVTRMIPDPSVSEEE